jgi:hypothetical protein
MTDAATIAKVLGGIRCRDVPLHGERIETRERIRLVPFDKIKLGTERRYLVKGLIPREGLTLLWGPPKCGKSFWATDLALHIALGWDYRGRKVVGGPAVYCAFEGAFGLGARLEAFRQKYLAEDTSGVPFFLVPMTLNLVRDQAELIAAVRDTLGSRRPVLVVLDTLNRSLAGSESSDEDMSAYVRSADAIREAFGCAVLVVHHCGINDSRPRGHTSLTGAADAQLSVIRDATSNIVVTVEHMKDGEEGEQIASRLEVLEVGVDEDTDTITSCVVIPIELPETKATGKAPRLPKSAKISLRALHKAVDETGAVPPASNHIPSGVCVIGLNAWRQYAYSMGISSGEDRAKQMAFKTAYDHLLAGRHIGVWNEQVWPT